MPPPLEWNADTRRELGNVIDLMDSYITNDIDQQLAALNRATGNETGNDKTLLDSYYNEMNNNLYKIKRINRLLSTDLNDKESSDYKTKLKKIGELQETIKNRKEKVKQQMDELEVAEAREDSIKNRNEESSYAQTFGYIFRPFRRISYAIIVPLIFIIIVLSVYLIWTTPIGMKITTQNTFPRASAPPANNFNAQMKKIFK
jgi:hypothetical protein